MRLVQGPILQGDNEIKWLREATGRYPRLSIVEYAESEQPLEEGRELQPMSFFKPMMQQTLAVPEEGWGVWDRHFWVLVHAVFCDRELMMLDVLTVYSIRLLRSITPSNLVADEISSLKSNLKVHEEVVNLLLCCEVINIDRVIPERDDQDVGDRELFFAEELAWANGT